MKLIFFAKVDAKDSAFKFYCFCMILEVKNTKIDYEIKFKYWSSDVEGGGGGGIDTQTYTQRQGKIVVNKWRCHGFTSLCNSD